MGPLGVVRADMVEPGREPLRRVLGQVATLPNALDHDIQLRVEREMVDGADRL